MHVIIDTTTSILLVCAAAMPFCYWPLEGAVHSAAISAAFSSLALAFQDIYILILHGRDFPHYLAYCLCLFHAPPVASDLLAVFSPSPAR